MLKLEVMFQFLTIYCLSLMKFRQFLELVSSQSIATAVGVINQCSIVYCNAVLRSAASTSLNLLFLHKLEGSTCNLGDLFD